MDYAQMKLPRGTSSKVKKMDLIYDVMAWHNFGDRAGDPKRFCIIMVQRNLNCAIVLFEKL